MKRECIVLAALLHDIGEVIFRALSPDQRDGRSPRELGYQWAKEMELPHEVQEVIRLQPGGLMDSGLPADAYQIPREIQNLVYLVAEADSIASGMERESNFADGNHGEYGLDVIFDRVTLDEERSENRQRHLWQPGLLEDTPYPVLAEQISREAFNSVYRKVWEGLREGLQRRENWQEDRLLLLLEKYVSLVPKQTHGSEQARSVTSLYQHLKTTAALSWCNYCYLRDQGYDWQRDDLRDVIRHRHESRYLLVGADLSGIQNFIYTIGSKAALKTLRARSFYLDLLIESAASQLCRTLSFGRSHLIYASGGGFYLLAPNTPACLEQIRSFQQRFNAWLNERYGTLLYLCVAAIPLSGADLRGDTDGLSAAWGELHRELHMQKNGKWEEFLTQDPEAFLGPLPVETECEVCHQSGDIKPVELDGDVYELCGFCRSMIDLGRTLATIERFYEIKKSHVQGVLTVSVYEATYAFGTVREDEILTEYRVVTPWDLPDGTWPVRAFPLGSYFSRSEFRELAGQAVGDKRIGVLRMDVDRLGQIFARGLDRLTFARMSELSARLNLYFKYYLPQLLKKEEGGFLPLPPRKFVVNVVYAGGDDLFLVGAWDSVLEAARAIYHDFRKYTGDNPDITLSGGLVVSDEKVALYKLADLAGAAEAGAKDGGRDRLALFGGVLTWQELERLREYFRIFGDVLTLEQLTVKAAFSRNFLNRFAALIEAYNTTEPGMSGNRAWILPQLYYLFSRVISGEKKGRNEKVERFYRSLLAMSLSDEALKTYLPPMLKILKHMLRGTKENDE